MKTLYLLLASSTLAIAADTNNPPQTGMASWYGEQHRGKLMANGKPFNPDKLTAASWFYPFGTKVRVTLTAERPRSIIVTITDRGPARRLVKQGRIIDLGYAAFKRLAAPSRGLIPVRVEPLESGKDKPGEEMAGNGKKGAPTGCAQSSHG